MTLYVLDTDHVTLFQHGHPLVLQRADAVSIDSLAVTIITAEEQVRGWLDSIRQATSASKLMRGYTRLHSTLDYFCTIPILDFSSTAHSRYEQLRHQKIRIGTQDLRIASIVLDVRGVLVTRNRRDFSQVPGLAIEDWSV